MAFSPLVLTINAGDTVTFQWAGSLTHTATTAINGCNPAPCPSDALFDSGFHTAPFTFTHTFTTGGITIDYVCLVHQAQGMTATINVLP
jgi:plastocyanin